MSAVPVLVTVTFSTYPLPQSLASAKATVQELVAGLPVTNVSGGDDHDTLPAVSRACTFTVYRLPGTRLPTVNEVPVTSPSCSLLAPFCRYTSYLAIGCAPAVPAGQEIVAAWSVTPLAPGWPGAPGAPAAGLAGCSTS